MRFRLNLRLGNESRFREIDIDNSEFEGMESESLIVESVCDMELRNWVDEEIESWVEVIGRD